MSARRTRSPGLWARRGTRPRLPHDQRTEFTYIFGAIYYPENSKDAGLIPLR